MSLRELDVAEITRAVRDACVKVDDRLPEDMGVTGAAGPTTAVYDAHGGDVYSQARDGWAHPSSGV